MIHSISTLPKISIVTPSYNQGKYIEETIESVLQQNYPDLEYIIMDGGSTDNTVSIIKKYEKHLKLWVSEKDKGQANAINKGFKYCTGEVFNWLNSDDYLTPGALQKIGKAFMENETQLVAGSVNNFSMSASEIVANKNLTATGLMKWDNGVQFVQPGVWLRKKLYEDCGGIDERYHYSFDWDLLIRYLFLFPNIKYIDDILVNFRLHEESKTVAFNERFVNEERSIIEKIYADNKFNGLHNTCKWKIDRTKWTSFLTKVIDDKKATKFKKAIDILTHINQQPADIKVTRMTFGALKKIFFS